LSHRDWDISSYEDEGARFFEARRKIALPGRMNIALEMLMLNRCWDENYVQQKFALLERRLAS
jgi:hypothetical protein